MIITVTFDELVTVASNENLLDDFETEIRQKDTIKQIKS